MDDPPRAPALDASETFPALEETIDLTTGSGTSQTNRTGPGLSSGGGGGGAADDNGTAPRLALKTYNQDKQRDYVRMIVTVGLLLMLFFVIIWSCIETASWSDHWEQTKEMLQTILPALTGLIGSVIGFYFGSGVKGNNNDGVTNDQSK
jgi:hypothetical protein